MCVVGSFLNSKNVVIVGHSYGAAVGALLANFISGKASNVHAFCFGCPPCYS